MFSHLLFRIDDFCQMAECTSPCSVNVLCTLLISACSSVSVFTLKSILFPVGNLYVTVGVQAIVNRRTVTATDSGHTTQLPFVSWKCKKIPSRHGGDVYQVLFKLASSGTIFYFPFLAQAALIYNCNEFSNAEYNSFYYCSFKINYL